MAFAVGSNALSAGALSKYRRARLIARLLAALFEGIMRIKIKKDIFIETDEMSLDALQKLNNDMQIEIDQMQVAIDTARARGANGEYSDIDWFRNITLALKLSRRHKEMLVRSISDRKKSINQQASITFERCFIDAAKNMLDPVIFRAIVSAAHAAANKAINPTPDSGPLEQSSKSE